MLYRERVMPKHATRDMERARYLPHHSIPLTPESKAWFLKLSVGQRKHMTVLCMVHGGTVDSMRKERESDQPFPLPLLDDAPAPLYSAQDTPDLYLPAYEWVSTAKWTETLFPCTMPCHVMYAVWEGTGWADWTSLWRRHHVEERLESHVPLCIGRDGVRLSSACSTEWHWAFVPVASHRIDRLTGW